MSLNNKNCISNDEIIQNIKKISDRYQEIILYLMQGKINIVPPSLINEDKNRTIFNILSEQYIANPKKFWDINLKYTKNLQELMVHSLAKFVGYQNPPLFTPHSKDKRFKDSAWQENIFFDFIKQFYLMSTEHLQDNIKQYDLTLDLKQHLEFIIRQFIDAFSPSNFVFCNPHVLRETIEKGGQNIVQGLENLLTDIKNSTDILYIQTTDKSAFKFGKNIASTKGKIIFQNQLVQLICYEPKEKTYDIPLLIIPPCINKYYILDLSVDNSMASFLVENNFQIFMISWVNPDKDLADEDFEDYIQKGILEPCEYIKTLGYKQINGVGYCIGGTFLATALAYMKDHNINNINSATFITTLLDFQYPGELSIFINESSITNIENIMKEKGYFDGRYLSNSFSLLRANDLLWSFFINNYLLGKTPIPLDLLYWNADPTNLPAKMHSYYLRNMYLNNLLKEPEGISILNTPIDLNKIDCNSFFIAANEDHIAPWKSVYESMKLLNGNKTFCLTSSGHIAGIVNPPTLLKYNYKTNETLPPSSELWLTKSHEHQGSWWTYWLIWLKANSNELIQSINYKKLKFIELAPGSYASRKIT